MLMVLLIGYRLAGALGAVVVGAAFFLPDCALTLAANRLWIHFSGSPWRQSVRQGLAPVAIGLMFAGTCAIASLSLVHVSDGSLDFAAIAIATVVTALLLWRQFNPGVLVLVGGTGYVLLAEGQNHLGAADTRLPPDRDGTVRWTQPAFSSESTRC